MMNVGAERKRKSNKRICIAVMGVILFLLIRHFQAQGRKLREAEEE